MKGGTTSCNSERNVFRSQELERILRQNDEPKLFLASLGESCCKTSICSCKMVNKERSLFISLSFLISLSLSSIFFSLSVSFFLSLPPTLSLYLFLSPFLPFFLLFNQNGTKPKRKTLQYF